MNEALAGFVTLICLATCWVLWREARFQAAGWKAGDAARNAAIASAYIAMGAAAASAAYRLYFLLSGIPDVLEAGRVADAGQLALSIVFLVLISGGAQLIERAARGVSLFVVDRRLQLNNASLAMFSADTAKAMAVSAAFGVPLAAGWIWLMEAGITYWWVAAWALWFAILTVRMLVKPQIETMLFSKAHDLPEGALRSRLEGLLDRCGIRTHSMSVIEASKRTNRVNASVNGLGAHKRIFLYDTLLDALNAGEVEAVLAHEAGHVRHRHLGLAWAGLGLLGLAGAYAIAKAVTGAQWAPAQTVAIVLAVFPSALLLLRPLLVGISRRFEFQADAYAAKQCGPTAIQDALRKIFAANHGVWEHHWAFAAVFAGHPSGRERIERLQELLPSA
ncbi:MAG TPA: M48 family metalloprotease [Hyphomicrobium sp.]|nr:M48 family metalloprotease [Hyphomicrobium sp.]